MKRAFEQLITHQVSGTMFHRDMICYFNFLSMPYFAKIQEERYREESEALLKTDKYYISNNNEILKVGTVEQPGVIPESWREMTRQEATGINLKNAVETALEKWLEWEKETKDLYQRIYYDLNGKGEISHALYVIGLIKDVSEELTKATEILIRVKRGEIDED